MVVPIYKCLKVTNMLRINVVISCKAIQLCIHFIFIQLLIIDCPLISFSVIIPDGIPWQFDVVESHW